MSEALDAHGQLRSLIDRILRLKEEQDSIADDIREVYAEGKTAGFDKTGMGQLVSYLRKKEKDAAKLEEQSTIFDLYLSAYEDRPSHAHTREGSKSATSTGGSNAKSADAPVENLEPLIDRRRHDRAMGTEHQPSPDNHSNETPAGGQHEHLLKLYLECGVTPGKGAAG